MLRYMFTTTPDWTGQSCFDDRAAGRYSFTLDRNNVSRVVTQYQDGCVVPCTKGAVLWPARCEALLIGSATIAAQPIRYSLRNDDETLVMMKMLEKSRAYSVMRATPLPWCADVMYIGNWHDVNYTDAPPVSVLVSGLDPPLLVKNVDGQLVIHDPRFDTRGIAPRVTSGVVLNCTLWDSLMVGFANVSDANRTTAEAMKTTPAKTFADLSAQFWQPVDDIREVITDFGFLGKYDLEGAMQTLVGDAAKLLQTRVNQELATTDFTKSRQGALLDISITLVAAVAMASGCGDIVAWLDSLLNTCFCHVLPDRYKTHAARVVSCIIVCLGLVVAPAFVLYVEITSQTNSSNDGKKTELGILAADTGQGFGPYMLVGIVTVRLETEYDHAALPLEWFNIVFACVAAVCI